MFVEIFSRARAILEDDPFSNMHFQHAHVETMSQTVADQQQENGKDAAPEILSVERQFCSIFGFSGT